MIHIGQIHSIQGVDPMHLPGRIGFAICSLQNRLSIILNSLVKEGAMNVFVEGLKESMAKRPTELLSRICEVNRLLEIDSENHPHLENEEGALIESVMQLRNGLGAPIELLINEKVHELHPGEPETCLLVDTLIPNCLDGDELCKLVLDPRNHDGRMRFCVRAVGDFHDTENVWSPSIVVYGCSHDFRPYIDEWNAENPMRQMALLVVTPAAIMDMMRFIPDLGSILPSW